MSTETRYETAQDRELRLLAEHLNAEVWTEHGPVGVRPLAADEIVGRRRPRTSAAPERLADDAVVSLVLR